MIRQDIRVTGVARLQATLASLSGEVDKAAEAGMRKAVLRGVSIVRGKASGRPGPRVITGHYRRSINGQVSRGAGSVQGRIGTNAPQAARLENGFTGTDSKGRYYRQPPFPHFGPALPEVQAYATQVIGEEIRSALG